MKKQKIAVVGCGIGGLTASILLARGGHQVSIYERFEKPMSVGAGILLQPIGLIALQRLGLLEVVKETASPVKALVGYNLKQKRVMDIHYGDINPNVYALGVHRGNLFSVLYETAIAEGVEIYCDINVLSLSDIKKQYDGVIIANGTQSLLREELNIKQRCIPYPWGALWAILPDPEQRFRDTLMQRYSGSKVMIGVLPTGLHPNTKNPCVSFFWSLLKNDYALWQKSDFEKWKDKVVGYWSDLEYLFSGLENHSSLTFAHYGDVKMQTWNEKNVVCIGDAAHGMSPQLGMGANLAMIDGLVLAGCLSDKNTIEEAFVTYSKERQQHVKYYQFVSRWLTPFFQSNSQLAGFVRDMSFPLFNKSPFAYKQALHTIAGTKKGIFSNQLFYDLKDF